MVSDSISTLSGIAGCFISGPTSTSCSLLPISPESPRRMISGSPARSMIGLTNTGFAGTGSAAAAGASVVAGGGVDSGSHAARPECRARDPKHRHPGHCRNHAAADRLGAFSSAATRLARKLRSISCMGRTPVHG